MDDEKIQQPRRVQETQPLTREASERDQDLLDLKRYKIQKPTHDLLRHVRPFFQRWRVLAALERPFTAPLHIPTLTGIALGLCLGSALMGPTLALLLAGGGHGYHSPLCVSWAFLIGGVGPPVWWFIRRRRVGTALALAVWLLADGLLVFWTLDDIHGLARVWRLYPGAIVGWYMLWLIPQASLLWLLIRTPSAGRAGDGEPGSQAPRPGA